MGILGLLLAATFADIPLPETALVAHLDASDSASVTRDGDGYVTGWKSSVGWSDGSDMVFTAPDHNDGSNEYGKKPPYDASAYGGRGAVKFGFNTAGANVCTGLISPIPDGGKFTNAVAYVVAQRSYENNKANNYDNLYGKAQKANEVYVSIYGRATPAYFSNPQFYFWGSGSMSPNLYVIDGVTELAPGDVKLQNAAPFS